MRPDAGPPIRSLAWATDIDVLPADRVLERHPGYWLVRSPSNPAHWWGNFLLFDDAPSAGDGERWESIFDRWFGAGHRTLAWDRPDGELGAADEELVARGYRLDHTVALVAAPAAIRAHPRESADVEVRPLDPLAGADEDLWEQVITVQTAARDASLETEVAYRAFSRRRQDDLRALFRLGRGAWWVALDGGDVVGSLGIVVSGPRARYQAVDTLASHRGRGICSRLVVEAAERTRAANPSLRSFVICADPGYHALGIYESVGFAPGERVCGALRPPGAAGA